MQRSSSAKKDESESAVTSFTDLVIAYHKNTGMACKALDGYLAFCAFTGIMQAIYCVAVSSFPYNAFIGTFAASVGSFVFAANIRLKWSKLGELEHQEILKSVTEFLVCSLILHMFVANFIG